MPHILRNNNLEIQIDLPHENYNFSRFDYTGKIVKLKFHNIDICGVERIDPDNSKTIGKGLYNEFGIDAAIGFNEASKGNWFHKIGVGLLKKEGENEIYEFLKAYKIKPCRFEVEKTANKLLITCFSETINGYSYILKKYIELFENSFKIQYDLLNTGSKVIETSEYNHNFLAFNNEFINSDYILTFPFKLKPELFEENLNPEQKVTFNNTKINFTKIPCEPFFFSNLSGNKLVNASWELINLKNNIGIREIGSFKTNKINLWGCTHVISPELFYQIYAPPKENINWSRTYEVYNLH